MCVYVCVRGVCVMLASDRFTGWVVLMGLYKNHSVCSQ